MPTVRNPNTGLDIFPTKEASLLAKFITLGAGVALGLLLIHPPQKLMRYLPF